MNIPRREFFRLLGLATGAAGLGGCGRFWSTPERMVDLALRGPGLESWTQTVCALCEGSCGLSVRLVDGIPVGLKGNAQHPLNRGGLCPVGQAGLDVLYAPHRIRGPLRRTEDGAHVPATWDEILAILTDRIGVIRSREDTGRIVFLNGDPSRLQDDLVRQFMGALGSSDCARPRDPSAFAYQLMQGLEEPPCFDLGGADLVVSFGQAVFEDGPAPLHAISTLVGARPDGEKAELIHVGTRLSASASKARNHVTVRPGTHGAFALGVAQVLVREGIYDKEFITEHTVGFDDFTDGGGARRMGFRRLLVERYYPDRVAQLCGCEASSIVDVARRLASAEAPLALVGTEAAKESNGTWNSMAIHALNALTGSFNRSGGVVLPPQIPFAPMPSIPEGAVPDAGDSLFERRGADQIGSPDPVEALVESVLGDPPSVELLFILGWNPVFETPLGTRLEEALSRIPTVVVFSSFLDETARMANYVLPTNVFLESWQCATTPPTVPYGTVGIGKPVVDPLFDTRHPGDVLLDLGRRIESISSEPLPWDDYEGYLRHRLEGLALAGQGSVFKGPLEEAWVRFLEERGWRFMEHQAFGSLWTDMVNHGGWWNPAIPQAAWSQLFLTPSEKFEFWSSRLEERLREVGRGAGRATDTTRDALVQGMATAGIEVGEDEACFPHHESVPQVGDGEVRLMTFRPLTARGSLGVSSAMLLEMFGHTQLSGWETWVEVPPGTAHELGLEDGDIVRFESETGRMELVVRLQPGGVEGVVHVPLGLGHASQVGPSAGIGTNPVPLLSGIRDPVSGVLSMNGAPGRIRLLRRRPHGGPAPSNGAHAP